MLDDNIKSIIKQSFANVREKMPDFAVRYAQNKMLAEASKTIVNTNSIICVEAPTGVGKTLAYLLSGIPIAKSLEKTLIISTATVALQEQLINKDLPDVQKYSLLDFNFKLIKGRSRYVCIRNLTHLSQSGAQNLIFNDNDGKDLNKYQEKQLDKLLKEYNSKSWNGEIDSLGKHPDKLLWSKIQCNHGSCGAQQCDFYQDCCFFNARKHIFSSDVLVANHDLVLADLMAGNNALPTPQESIYVFDEAHHLAAKALNHFQYEISLNSVTIELDNQISLLEQLTKIVKNSKNIDKFQETVIETKTIRDTLMGLLSNYSYNNDDIFLYKLGVIDDTYRNLCELLLGHNKNLAQIFNDIVDKFTDYKKTANLEQTIVDSLQTQISLAEAYYSNTLNLLTKVLLIDEVNAAPIGRWIAKIEIANKGSDYHLCCAKIDIADELKTMLWDKCSASILTSATLSSLGNFNRLSSQLGISDDNTQYLRLASPFKHSNVKFIVAKMQNLPNEQGYDEEVAQKLLKIIDKNSGTLVLFTANKQMQAVASLIENDLGVSLILQGEASKQDMLTKHKHLRDSGKASVIFGVDSFYEGVDLPRDYLTHVIIIKIKFSVPSTPIEQTTHDYLESQNINSFSTNSLPDASLKLIQASGRLIRSEADTGQITILDRRIVQKYYGKQLLLALPNYKIVVE